MPRLGRCRVLAMLLASFGCIGACESTPGVRRDPPVEREPSRVAVMINGVPVVRETLAASTAEIAGAAAIREAALDVLLQSELDRRGLAVTQADIDEQRAIWNSITGDTGVPPERVRRQRGLGPTRFAGTLRRNAAFAKLLPTPTVTQDELELARRVQFGERVQVRMIAAASERELARIRGSLASGPGTLEMRFADAAVNQSIDPSAAAGGLLPPISLSDPAFPEAVRSSLARLADGTLSPVIADGRRFLLLYRRGTLPAREPAPAQLVQLEQDLLQRKGLIERQAYAERLLRGAQITVFDRGLAWSFDQPASAARE